MSRPASILVVDDSSAKLAAIEATLESLNQRVVTADSGRAALRQLLREDFAVILLDVRMADLDGFETAELIRRRSRSEHTPIIFLTAFDKAEIDMDRGYRLGAVDFVFSPILPEILRAKVQVFVELHQQAQAIRDLYRQAQAASRAKSEFLNLAAHELRTPLSVISGYLSMLREGSLGDPPTGWQVPLELLAGKAEELNKIVNDLLLASRLDVSEVDDRRVPVDVRELARQAVDRAQARAALAKGTVELIVEDDQPAPVEADVDAIARVLDNLINNAMTYTVRDPEVKLVVTPGSPVLLRVIDNGIGISPDRREEVFDRFVRLDDPLVGPVPGTGLGLYISRQLARRHGGELLIERTEHGAGSTFTLSLPRSTEVLPATKNGHSGSVGDATRSPNGTASVSGPRASRAAAVSARRLDPPAPSEGS